MINQKHPTAGCARCRMDLIRFTREVKLPRFTMLVGEEWFLPQTSYRADGLIELGHGLAPLAAFEIVERDATRASHNNRPCRGVDLNGYPDALPECLLATR